jgi:hypothetical protein
MGEVIVQRDAVKAAIGMLKTELTDRGWTVTVASKIPSTRPQYMVKVTRTGGTRANAVTDRTQLTVQCWAPDDVKAFNLAALCHALLLSREQEDVGGVWVRKVEDVSGPTDFPDPDTSNPRVQLTVRWHTRGQSV